MYARQNRNQAEKNPVKTARSLERAWLHGLDGWRKHMVKSCVIDWGSSLLYNRDHFLFSFESIIGL